MGLERDRHHTSGEYLSPPKAFGFNLLKNIVLAKEKSHLQEAQDGPFPTWAPEPGSWNSPGPPGREALQGEALMGPEAGTLLCGECPGSRDEAEGYPSRKVLLSWIF